MIHNAFRRLLALAVALAALATVAVSAGSVMANAATCRTTYTYSHTSSGTAYSTTWSTRRTCGTGLYQLWSHRVGRTATGSVSDAHTYRNAWPVSHYWQEVNRQTITARGKVSYTVTITRR